MARFESVTVRCAGAVMRARQVRAVVATLIALWLAVTHANGVLAHAEPERAEPPIDGTVQTLPDRLEVWFDEEVAEATLTVRAPDGTVISQGEAELDLQDPERRHVTIALSPNGGPGTYVVEWTSRSAEDEDPAEGSFSFTVAGGATPGASPEVSPSASPATSPVASPPATPAEPTAVATQAPAAPSAEEGDFDSRAFGLSVLAGLVAALFIYLFWRLVRPKPGR